MEAILPVLYAASNLLLLPVALALLGLGLASLALVGGLLRELPARRRWQRERRGVVAALHLGEDPRALSAGLQAFPQARLLHAPEANRAALVRALGESCRRSLLFPHFGSRAGPALGLMGTLIPLGPALTALATGDLATLSERLVVAFTTTVAGLLVGVLCFAVAQVRSRWYSADLLWLEILLGEEGEARHA
ncbi:MAG: MotA/TolQ/ExbB proton channel family protein [Planctomycetota bacterium]